MFAYRRKRSLGCEQLEGRFAPSSVLVGGGGRSAFKDAQAVDTTQAAQAAFYLAASAVMSQSSSVAPVSGVQRVGGSEMPVFIMYQMPDGTIVCGGGFTGPMHRVGGVDLPQPTTNGTASEEQPAEDNGGSSDIPSSNADGTNNASLPSNDAAPVAVEPVSQQPVGVDDPAAVDPQPVSDSAPVTSDRVTDPTSVDDGPPITDASGAGAVDAVPVEPQTDNAAGDATLHCQSARITGQ